MLIHRTYCDILIMCCCSSYVLFKPVWVPLYSQYAGNAGLSLLPATELKSSVSPRTHSIALTSLSFVLSLSPELVLKVRIQNPSARENDFIEVELDRQELTYRSLLRVCCRELGISAEHVEKIRKLPNTMLRKVRG